MRSDLWKDIKEYAQEELIGARRSLESCQPVGGNIEFYACEMARLQAEIEVWKEVVDIPQILVDRLTSKVKEPSDELSKDSEE